MIADDIRIKQFGGVPDVDPHQAHFDGPKCFTCVDHGWVDQSLGAPAGVHCSPTVCPDCGNPEGLPSP